MTRVKQEENRKLFEQMMSELGPEILEKASLAKNPSSDCHGSNISAAEYYQGLYQENRSVASMSLTSSPVARK